MKKRSDGRYVKVITVNGEKTYIYGKTAREVTRKLMQMERKKTEGGSFKEIADEWWDMEVESLSPSTIRGYHAATKRAKEYFGEDPITEITTADITRYLHELKRKGYAKKTVKNHKIIVNRIFHYAVVEGLLTVNPAAEAELPRNLSENKRRAATPSDEERIAAAKDTNNDAWLLPVIALYTGMRKGEILGLKVKDIDLDKDLIKVERSLWYASAGRSLLKEPKTEAGKRSIPILAPLKPHLRERLKNASQEHFIIGGDKPISEKRYRVLWEKFKRESGCTCTIHQLRKSFATMAVSSNVPPDVLQSIIGHADISTTINIYNEVRAARIALAKESMEKGFSTPEK